MKSKLLLLTIGMCMSTFLQAQSQLATWEFSGHAGESSVSAQALLPGISSATVSLGAGLEAFAYYVPSGEGLTAKGQTATTLNMAVAPITVTDVNGDEYISIKIAPASGYKMNISQISFAPVSENQTRSFTLMSSLQPFTAGNELGTQTSNAPFNGTPLVYNLTGHTDITSEIEFRVYIYSPTANIYESLGMGKTSGIDLQVLGTVTQAPAPLPIGNGSLGIWEFAGKGGQSSVTVSQQVEGLSSGTASLGAGFTVENYLGNGLTGTQQTATDLAGAISSNEYIKIQVAPANGKRMNITQVIIRAISQNRARSFALFSSQNGFTADKAIAIQTADGNFNGPLLAYDISDHTNLTAPVEFRLYIYGYNNQYESVGIGNADGTDLYIQGSLTDGSAIAGWTIEGNASSVDNFLGTINNQDLNIKTNNVNRIKVASTGDVTINSLNGTGSSIPALDATGKLSRIGNGAAGQYLQYTASGPAWSDVNTDWTGSTFTSPNPAYGGTLVQLTNNWKHRVTLLSAQTQVVGDLVAWQGIQVGGRDLFQNPPDKVNGLPWYGMGLVQGNTTNGFGTFSPVQIAGYNGIIMLDGSYNNNANIPLMIKNGKVSLNVDKSQTLTEALEVNGNIKLANATSATTSTHWTLGVTNPSVFNNVNSNCITYGIHQTGSDSDGERLQDYFLHCNLVNSTLCQQCANSQPTGWSNCPDIQVCNGVASIVTNSNSLVINNDLGNIMTLQSNGNVGIGTSFIQEKLVVNGNIQVLGAYNGIKFSDGTILTTAGTGGLTGVNGDIELVNGRLIIGNPLPSTISYSALIDTKLTVNGRIVAKKFVTVNNLPWPDYVFDKKYNLMPLNELEKYVDKHNHLPEIPSALEIEKDGLELSEMNGLLLKKIEELTIYLLKQDKRIKELETKISK